MTSLLGNVRVVELGQVIAGTVGGMILADLGADVIKVERPQGDPGRRSAVYGIGDESAIHLTLNRNKRSVALDLKSEAGRAILLDLVARADAVIENFRPGVLERLGVGFDELRAVNPSLVLVSVNGFGADSPYRDFPAYDLIMQAMSGHMSIMGEPGRPPVIMGIPLADLIAGVYSSIAVLAGLVGRGQTEGATHFDLAMLDVMVSMLAHVGSLHLNTGMEQEPQGSSHPFITPWQAFRCADGRYVVVAPREEHFWERLCDCLALEELKRPEYADAVSRQRHRRVLLPVLEAAFEERSSEEWLVRLRDAGVPVAPVNNLAEIFSDPHVEQRDMVAAYDLDGRTIRVVGDPFTIVGQSKRSPRAAPAIGADTDDVLLHDLGYDRDEVDRLRNDSVVA